MSTPQTQFASLLIPEVKNRTTDLKSVITRYLFHWPLYTLGMIFSVCGVWAYLYFVKPSYEVKATLLIKDEKKAPEQQSALSEIDLLNSSNLLENEMEVLKSKQLISQVINKLQLQIIYEQQKGLVTKDLYKINPVSLVIIKDEQKIKNKEITIKIKDKEHFLLKEDGDSYKEYQFNKVFRNKFGSWRLASTGYLLKYKDAIIKIRVLNPDLLALQYQKRIDVSLANKMATAVLLSLKDEVPQRGEDILNQLMLNYYLAGKSRKEREAEATIAFLDQRLSALTSSLTTSEKGIEGFKSSRGITDISSESKINLESMQVNDSKLNEVNVQLSVVQGIENYVNSSKNTGNAPATIGLTDPALSSLIEKLSQLQLQRDRLLATTPETNPDFDPINRQIASTRTAIKENVKNIKSSLQNTRVQLLSFSAGLESSIKNIPTQERQLISIKRDQAIKENLYNYLLQKREEVSLRYANITSNDLVMDEAYAGAPITPRKDLILAVSVLLGLCIPSAIIFGRNMFNNSIVDVREITDVLDIPVIGEISEEGKLQLIEMNSRGSSAINEQFRAIRTNLHYLTDIPRGRVILTTSSIPSEGKSFVSSNLALSLAQIERKVIILELDLRKPKIAEIFNLKKDTSGISDYLNKKSTLQEIIRKSELSDNLDVVGCGTIVNNPSELLEKELFKSLMNELRQTYDDIVIDSPPVHIISDALILSRYADITLFVMKQGLTGKAEVSFLKDLLKKKQFSNVQIIFNGVQKAKYGYGYDYNPHNYIRSEKKSIFDDFWGRF